MDGRSDEYFLKGLEAYEAERYEDAVDAFTTSLREDIKNWEARMYLGASLFRLGNFDASGRVYREVTTKCPDLQVRLRATKALDSVEQRLANELNPEHTLTGVLRRPSEETLQKIHQRAKDAAEAVPEDHSAEIAEMEAALEESRHKKKKSRSGATPAAGTESIPEPVPAFVLPEDSQVRKPIIPDSVGIPLIVLAVVGVIYFLGSLGLGQAFNQAISGPTSVEQPVHVNVPSSMAQENTFFVGPGGVKLDALFVHGSSKDIVLINRDTAGSIADDAKLVEALGKIGASVFIYDYRGIGRSEGKRDARGALDDALLAHAYIHGILRYDYKNIIFYGKGVGAGIAAELDRRIPGKCTVLVSGYNDLKKVAKQKNPLLNLYPDSMLPQVALQIAPWAKQHNPTLLSTSDDSVIPPAVSNAFNESVADPKKVVTMKKDDFEPVVSFIQPMLDKE
jgi:alpha/beta superfamily hydrolase